MAPIMKIRLMRQIDYWIGIPLCLLLTIINCILRLFVFKREGEMIPKKILFIKLSEMGGIILAYSLLNKTQEVYPEAEIFFLTFEKNRSLFQILNIVPSNNVLTIRENSIQSLILDTLRVISRLRKERIDITFDLEFFSRFTAILTYLSGADKRIGFYPYSMEGLYRGNLLTHKVQYNPLIHISKSYLSLLQVVEKRTKSTPELEEKIENREITLPRFIFSEEEKRRVWAKLKEFGITEEARLFLVNSGEGNIPLREWPLENFIDLSKLILENSNDSFIIIIGTQNSLTKGEVICNTLNSKRCLNLVDKTTLRELLTLFSLSEALIVNDCGLAHLASLTPIRKFILFGPESPQVYSPIANNSWMIFSGLPCSPCLSAFNHRDSACRDNLCLKMIKPQEVYNLIVTHLKERIL